MNKILANYETRKQEKSMAIEYLLVYFENEQEFLIVQKNKCRNISNDTCEVLYEGKWFNAIVKKSGSYDECQKKAKKYKKKGYFTTDDEEKHKQRNKKTIKRTMYSTEFTQELIETGTSDTDGKIPYMNENSNDADTIDNISDPENYTFADKYFDEKSKLDLILSKLEKLELLIETNHSNLQAAIEQIKVKNKDKQWLTEVMYNNTNLLDIQATQLNKYVNTLMELMYTKEEMQNGLIIFDSNTRSTRKPLDLNKFEIILKAAINKYKLSESKAKIEIRNICCRKCYDTKLE